MARFVIEDDRPLWVREFYAVEARNEEEAELKYYDGHHEYLGHTVLEQVEGRDSCRVSVTKSKHNPFMAHPA